MTRLSNLLPAVALLSTAFASPMPAPTAAPILEERAGAPIVTRSIPSECHTSVIFSPPASSATATATATSTRYTPAAALPTLYSYHLDPAQFASSTHDELYKQCIDTCFNFGETWNFTAPDDGGKCRAAYMAWDVPNPFAAGSPKTGIECLMFNTSLDISDFEAVPSNTTGWDDAVAKDLGCPQKCA